MKAVFDLVVNGISIRKAAVESNLECPTLRRYVEKIKSAPDENMRLLPNDEINMIFTSEQKDALISKLMHLFYGLGSTKCRRLYIKWLKSIILKYLIRGRRHKRLAENGSEVLGTDTQISHWEHQSHAVLHVQQR